MAKTNQVEQGELSEVDLLKQEIAHLRESVDLLKFAAGKLKQAQDQDPNTIYERAAKIIGQSRQATNGPYKWRVFIPGFLNPIEFTCDSERKNDAIHEFESRFGTRFITNKQRESDNHRIESVKG